MTYEDVKDFLKNNNFLDKFECQVVELTFNKNDLDIDHMIGIYKTRKIVALNNSNISKKALEFIEDIVENLSAEKDDVKIRIITVKGETKTLKIITNNQLSKTYGVLHL